MLGFFKFFYVYEVPDPVPYFFWGFFVIFKVGFKIVFFTLTCYLYYRISVCFEFDMNLIWSSTFFSGFVYLQNCLSVLFFTLIDFQIFLINHGFGKDFCCFLVNFLFGQCLSNNWSNVSKNSSKDWCRSFWFDFN